MSAVLVDTSPLYALAVPSDQYHVQAQAESEQIRRQGLDVVIAYPVVIETYQLLLRRVPLVTAHGWLTQMSSRGSFVNPRDEDYLEATQRVRRYRDQPLTLVDAVVAVLSDQGGAPVWSYDHHFDIMRIDRWR